MSSRGELPAPDGERARTMTWSLVEFERRPSARTGHLAPESLRDGADLNRIRISDAAFSLSFVFRPLVNLLHVRLAHVLRICTGSIAQGISYPCVEKHPGLEL